ncbi:MAG: hypothetical protein R2713_06195 [Ilumatobacteraceae bacterium]
MKKLKTNVDVLTLSATPIRAPRDEPRRHPRPACWQTTLPIKAPILTFVGEYDERGRRGHPP